jgi:hypothetical protein
MPVTRRAELAMGRAATAALPAPLAPSSEVEVFLLASERSTGQPPPPEPPASQRSLPRAETGGRVAIGLSGA